MPLPIEAATKVSIKSITYKFSAIAWDSGTGGTVGTKALANEDLAPTENTEKPGKT